VAQHDLPRALDWAAGRMKRKVIGAQEALDGGVRRVVIGDGRVVGAVSAALNGVGTEFVRTGHSAVEDGAAAAPQGPLLGMHTVPTWSGLE
jgi:acetylglutamate/LysW-gamma-L-alpha-aminoadipate kinase